MNLKMEKLVINLFMTDEISNKTPLILYNWLHQHTTNFERLSMYTGDFKIFM